MVVGVMAFAGFTAGLLGIGGALIFNPVLLQLGVQPQVSALSKLISCALWLCHSSSDGDGQLIRRACCSNLHHGLRKPCTSVQKLPCIFLMRPGAALARSSTRKPRVGRVSAACCAHPCIGASV